MAESDRERGMEAVRRDEPLAKSSSLVALVVVVVAMKKAKSQLSSDGMWNEVAYSLRQCPFRSFRALLAGWSRGALRGCAQRELARRDRILERATLCGSPSCCLRVRFSPL